MVSVRVLHGILLDWPCHATIGVAFAEHRIDGAAQDLGIATSDLRLLLALRIRGKVRDAEAFRLELLDCTQELRHGGRNVGQLDDVGCWMLGETSQFRQIVLHALCRRDVVREVGQDAGGQGDVLLHDLHPGEAAVGAQHREQGIGRQHGRFVRVGVHDLDVRNLEADRTTRLVCLLKHSKLCPRGHVVQPLRELHRSILVHIQL
mmetsp:Transcript_37967/g.81624  ORF Transcript_37967/g.81624 Transcript_37967/m.81624 type:complete len:205 (-) Transcript_37967:310-924(-)